MLRLSTLTAAAVLFACQPSPPPSWQPGGAPLVLPNAVWQRDDDRIEVRSNGDVLEDGDLLYKLDRVGRVVDDDYAPVALLLRDGTLAGTDDQHLGRIGVHNAAPPGGRVAWLTVAEDGTVVFYGPDGDRDPAGRWSGCAGPGQRACTLVTHLVRLRAWRRRPRMTFGVGAGVWF